ncbi:CHASE2 domain-containing protein [Brasilonema sp. UFV-L1]|uniref:CHASE2 domain-containing protein n=1 Tax=Brasilonema sp. UFV-L1 TaxID=2234130 RepID=UPI0030D8430E
MAPTQSIEIYLSCSPEDEELGSKLAKHLRALELDGVITVWQNRDISAGAERANEIEKRLNSARIILLLISPDFFASDEHWKRDVPKAMERHKAKEACVIPVLLRPCDWKNTQFSHLQALPRNGEAITSKYWSNHDEAFKQVAEEIRKAIENKSDVITLPQTDRRRFKIPWRSLRTLLKASMGVSTVVIIIRLGGILQSLELAAYDELMRFQLSYFPEEQQDKRLLIIKITKEDAAKEEEKASKSGGKNGTLTDASLAQLLKKLTENQPLAIGLDFYRDYPSRDEKLKELLKNENIFALCKAPKTEDSNDNGINPPLETEISPNRVGFSDLAQQKEVILRRQLLSLFLNSPQSGCKSKNAFNLLLARSYLASREKKQGNQDAFDLNGNLQDLIINGVVLEQLKIPHTGGYRGMDFRGYQILLDYRSFCENGNNCSPYNIAKTFSLKQVLEDNLLKEEDVEKRIVLIGVEANSYANDYVYTPYSQQEMPGFIVQAQMLSYLLRIALGEQRQLRVWSLGYEILWILAWSLVGGILAQLYKSPRSLILSGGVALTSLYVVCLIFFISPIKLWVPLVPSALTFLGTGGVVVFISFRIR